ncbi:unannotated protein [freshwater metagenome]|uniref:Unannotated protein n=1 Tax=freshwater metagenome TaxID=449393 RepID=A0A6J6AA15_9ZZZZ
MKRAALVRIIRFVAILTRVALYVLFGPEQSKAFFANS